MQIGVCRVTVPVDAFQVTTLNAFGASCETVMKEWRPWWEAAPRSMWRTFFVATEDGHIMVWPRAPLSALCGALRTAVVGEATSVDFQFFSSGSTLWI